MKPETREGFVVLFVLLAVIFCLVGIWTAPYPTAARAAITSTLFVVCAVLTIVAGRRKG